MAVESVVECAWNGWTNQRGITGRMTVEWVVEWAWNTQSAKEPLRLLCCCAPAYSHGDTELLDEGTAATTGKG
jgi:hypothetical protein